MIIYLDHKIMIFYDITTIKTKLLNTIPKQDWGMIWSK